MSGGSGSSSSIGGDILGGLGMLGGGILSLMPGGAAIGIPMMVGGAGSILGSNLGGGAGGGKGSAMFAPPFSSSGGAATGPAAPPISMGGSPLTPPSTMGDILASANPMMGAPAPTMLDPNLAGAMPQGASTLNPNVSQAGPAPANTGLALQDAGGVGQAYQNYLLQSQRLKYQPTYVGGHSSAVLQPQLNPFAPNQSSPINPPQLRV